MSTTADIKTDTKSKAETPRPILPLVSSDEDYRALELAESEAACERAGYALCVFLEARREARK